MTQDEMIATLKEAGWPESMVASIIMQKLFEVIKMVEAKEREACANLCEDQTQEYHSDGSDRAMNYQCADAIRARGEA